MGQEKNLAHNDPRKNSLPAVNTPPPPPSASKVKWSAPYNIEVSIQEKSFDTLTLNSRFMSIKKCPFTKNCPPSSPRHDLQSFQHLSVTCYCLQYLVRNIHTAQLDLPLLISKHTFTQRKINNGTHTIFYICINTT